LFLSFDLKDPLRGWATFTSRRRRSGRFVPASLRPKSMSAGTRRRHRRSGAFRNVASQFLGDESRSTPWGALLARKSVRRGRSVCRKQQRVLRLRWECGQIRADRGIAILRRRAVALGARTGAPADSRGRAHSGKYLPESAKCIEIAAPEFAPRRCHHVLDVLWLVAVDSKRGRLRLKSFLDLAILGQRHHPGVARHRACLVKVSTMRVDVLSRRRFLGPP